MANIAGTPRAPLGANGDQSMYVVTWVLAQDDVPLPVAYPGYNDVSIQVAGTPGGATIACHGSNDGTNYSALNDPTSTPIALAAAGIKQVLESTVWRKPVMTGSGGTTALTVTMFFRLNNPLRT